MSSALWPDLPEPQFIDRDPATIERDMVAQWEAATGKTLYPAQPERVGVNNAAYRETLVRIAVQEAAKLNLLRYARFPMLDFLGELVDTARLPASPARCTLRLTRASGSTALVLPAGVQVSTSDGGIVFVTDAETLFAAGSLTREVPATALQTGASGNGFSPGQVSRLVSGGAGLSAATNLTATAGGADAESDDAFRERIRRAPEKFSTAGPSGAYDWHARAVSQSIIDVAVTSPRPGDIEVVILTDSGQPSTELLAAVSARLNDRSVRPMGDSVTVRGPVGHPVDLHLSLTLTRDADPVTTLAAAEAALTAYVATRRRTLGRDVVAEQIIAAAMVPGLYSAKILAPSDAVLAPLEWFDGRIAALEIAGRADE